MGTNNSLLHHWEFLVQVIKLINVYLMITVGLVLCKAAGGSMMKIKPLGKSLPCTMSYV